MVVSFKNSEGKTETITCESLLFVNEVIIVKAGTLTIMEIPASSLLKVN
jgi:hypothetical protein